MSLVLPSLRSPRRRRSMLRNRLPLAPRPSERRPESRASRNWVMIFILVSLLAHFLFVVGIVVLNRFLPKPDLKAEPPEISSTTLSLEPPPPSTPTPASPPKHVFMPTKADAEAPHKETLFESDNDVRLKSESTTARAPDSVMPDLTSPVKHPADLEASPNAPSSQPPRPEANATQQNPAQQQSTTANQSPQTTPQPAQAPQPTPQPQPQAKETKPQPAQKTSPEVAQQQVDENGLPVLPQINAPTMAPASQQRRETSPAASLPAVPQDIHGALGAHGDTSPEAMKTELGKYKAKIYAAVGSRWYPKVDTHFQVLPVGTVDIEYTVHSDGTVQIDKVLSGDTGTLQLLLSISENSIREAGPFDPFPPALIKEVGDSYTDDFTFSIYGN